MNQWTKRFDLINANIQAGLSNWQGMISQGEVELSVISKNFFFTFFNLFLLYTVLGSATNLIPTLRDSFNDSRDVAMRLAKQLEVFGQFYINLIVLQGFGLLPFRLLEFGSVAYYPIGKLSAKTPRGKYPCLSDRWWFPCL